LLSGTAVGIVVITFLAGLFLFVTFQNHHQATLRSHTLDVLQLSRTIESDLAAAESIHRGYLLTGDTAFIKAFDSRKELIKSRTEELTLLILDSQNQRKRVMKVQEIVQKWLDTVALPQLAQQRGRAPTPVHDLGTITSASLGNALLDQAREILRTLQDEEQIALNERMKDQEWATQLTTILDLLNKVERSLLEMQKEKKAYLLTGDNSFSEAYRRATADFYTYHGYLTILVANSPTGDQSLTNLKKGVDRWIATSAVPEMEAKRNGKDLTTLLATDKGDDLMMEIRDTLSSFQKYEAGLHEER